MNVQDILYVLFKHKWKIILTSAIGIGAAAAVYLTYPTVYESQAKLLVRYVVDTSAIDQVDSRATASSSESVINSEVEILTSWDLAMQVASAVEVERLLPESGGKADIPKAAGMIRTGLEVTAPRRTSIISVSYRNADPELAVLVLKELVARYFTKHLEVHRSAGAFNYVAQQSDQVLARLNQTEEELKRLKDTSGITSLTETTTTLSTQLSKTRDALQAAAAEISEQRAVVREMEKTVASQSESPPHLPTSMSIEAVDQYHATMDRLRQVRETQLALLSKPLQNPDKPVTEKVEGIRQIWTESTEKRERLRGLAFVGNERDMAHALARERYRQQNDTGFAYQTNKKSFDTLVKEAEHEILGRTSNKSKVAESETELVKLNQVQIENLEKQRSDLEKKFPGIASSVNVKAELPTVVAERAAERAFNILIKRMDPVTERARLAGIEAKREALKSYLNEIEKQAEHLSEVGPQIAQLERKKELEETNYKYLQASLEKARIDEALDPTKMPNISIVQSPSAAFRAGRDLKKIVLGLAGGGIAVGLAFAFLMEMIMDRSIKRPLEVETLLGIPLLLSIPYLNGRNPLRLLRPRSGWSSVLTLRNRGRYAAAPWDSDHFIRRYSEAIRDRLVLYFEFNQMTHKPKLVAVTDCSSGAGASTLAGGIAAAFSETGDGKVLLVDMNVGRPEIHPFSRGAPACSLTEALVGAPAPAGDNLYLAVGTSPGAPQAPLIPRRFSDLMPHLKASDFDYIIFDMPPLGQTSITLPMVRLMDKVIVVAEAEKTNRDFLKRAYAELIAYRASVSIVFNKARSYIPKSLGAES